jgi:hypothetical protein
LVSLPARHLAQNAEALEVGQQRVGGGLRDIERGLEVCGGHDRLSVQDVERTASVVGALAECEYVVLYLRAECQDLAEGVSPLDGRLSHALEEEPNPVGEVVGDTHASEGVVVAPAVALEEVGQVERRLGEEPGAHEVGRLESGSRSRVRTAVFVAVM